MPSMGKHYESARNGKKSHRGVDDGGVLCFIAKFNALSLFPPLGLMTLSLSRSLSLSSQLLC